MRLSPAIKISFALALLSSSILIFADLLGLVPNERAGVLEGRKKFCESLAVQVSLAATRNDMDLIGITLKSVVARNHDILSAALRKTDGQLLAQAGDHAENWSNVGLDKSTPSHVQVPILKGNARWGTVEVAFAPLWQGPLDRLIDSLFGLVMFVAALGFIIFLLFIKKILRELDPKSVVPDRVKAAFNALAEGLLILDEKERIILANDSFADKIHTTSDELVGLKASALNWQANDAHKQQAFPWQRSLHEQQRQTGTPLKFQDRHQRIHTFMVNTAPIMDTKQITRGVLATFDDMTDLEKKHKDLKQTIGQLYESQEALRYKTVELEYLATRDALTGCLNRRSFLERYDAAFLEATETGDNLACMMMDIDHFKSINDRYGHVTGDQVLQIISELLRADSRPGDLVGRYGGEEFSFILPNTSLEQGISIAERLCKKMPEHLATRMTHHAMRVTASFGVTQLSSDVSDPAQLISRADKALYLAKERGRNRVAYWEPQGESTDHSDEKDADVVLFPSRDDPSADPGAGSSSRSTGHDTELHRLQERVLELERELEYTRQVIEQPSELDSLTGLPNQIAFSDRIRQAVAHSERNNCVTAVICLDIDAFNRVNDALGHAVGDQLLKAVATRLIDVLRSVDTVAVLGNNSDPSTVSRLTSDEFGILITDLTNIEPVTWIIKRMFDSLSEKLKVDDHEIFTTCSAGVSIYPDDAKDPETLLRNASTARNNAKRRFGRNNLRFFSRDINKIAYRQLWLESQLHRALEARELELNYQPIVDLKTGQVLRMEALLRWSHSKLGLVPPSEFVSVAEHTGLIGMIGEFVIESACMQIREWLDQDIKDARIAVNLSPAQFRDAELAPKIISTIQEAGLEPHHLELEITETTLMDNFSEALNTMNDLYEAGFRFSIDDFGTGYSSLSYLKLLPVDSVKIDRSFLSDTLPSQQDQGIISAIISMSHSLGLRVVAEGVETDAQRALLRSLKCDQIQGYLIATPQPAEEAVRMLRSPAAVESNSAA